ncbi:MAG: hypothetical protein [Olavius algarvensis Gamma 1 endosymbiont]|nr:MAG: hypothetical protein [Olavius algarvensis Gamma 1 endosymbiont]
MDTSNSITSLARNNDSILDPIQSSGIQHLAGAESPETSAGQQHFFGKGIQPIHR